MSVVTSRMALSSPVASKDGAPYCVNAPLPSVEGDLLTQPGLNPEGLGVVNPGQGVALKFQQAVIATVFFNVLQATNGTNYVILQNDNGDANWYDVAGCVFGGTFTQGQTATFVLPCGPYGTVAVIQQQRQFNVPPAANFFNPMPPGGRFRFMGKGVGQSSGSGAAITVTITYRLPPLR